jgi:hypothetical protein
MRQIEVVVIYKDRKHVFTLTPKLRKWDAQLDIGDDLTIFIASPPSHPTSTTNQETKEEL